MARNGSGTMSILNSFSANTTIESAKVNANFTDVASEITASLPRNGEAGMTGQFKAADGTSGAPGITFGSDLNCGFYRSAADTIAVAGTLTTNGTNKVDSFPSGTKLLFRQTAAPTGWTKDTTYTNAALRVTSGTISQQATAGKEFSTLFAARTLTEANLPVHSHTFSGTTSVQSANHTHSIPFAFSTGGGENGSNIGSVTAGTTITAGVSADHTHTYSGTTSSVGSAASMAFDVNFVDVIIATKD